MDCILQVHEKMLLELLRAALKGDKAESLLFESLTERDWKECFLFAKKQGVMALAWDGILTLPTHLFPPRSIKLSWALEVQRYEEQYKYYVQTSVELKKIYEKYGISMLLLKGVGLSTYYPVPQHREGGDIDLYLYSADKMKMNDLEARNLADQIIENLGIKVDRRIKKHSVFSFKKIPIENHKYFANISSTMAKLDLNAYLKGILNPQTTCLLNGKFQVLIPSPEFNTIFLALHAIGHLGKGLCLHHLCDWACLINRYGLLIPTEIKDKRFLSIIYTFTQFTNLYLGTNVKVNNTETLLENLTIEMLHPPFKHKVDYLNGPKMDIIFRLRRLYHYLQLRKLFLGESIFKGFGDSLFSHVRKPWTIFQHE